MQKNPNSDTYTDGIRVEAAAQLIPEQSDPEEGVHFYAYRIRISNEGEQAAQLLRRRWVVVDANNEQKVISGDGVVGAQPDLEPGGSFEYKSACHLPTEWGTMEGSYTFERPGGEHFDAEIGRFFLAPTIDNEFVLDSES